MAQTAGGTYYAASSELVSSWPATSLDLANQLESRFAAKAALASPALTGTPTAPTAAVGTNTTQIATTAFVQAAGGMVLVASQSLSGSSFSLNNVFSSTYENYRVIIQAAGSSTGIVNMRLRAAGTDNSGTVYNKFGYSGGAAASNINSTSQNTWAMNQPSNGDYSANDLLICQPNFNAATYMTGTAFDPNGYGSVASFRHYLAAQYDGFTLYLTTGTFSGGTVRVYGLRNS